MPATRSFRIAVEGATVDGRTIDRAWIDQMAAGYNPETYTARINCEHIAGFSPEPPFNAYGHVLALKAEDFQLQLDGKAVTKRALYAQLDANDQLLATVKKGQKLFTSCEISPNFANTGKAGLVGLAITDNPASLGTEMLQFAASASVNPLAARKKDAANHFSEALEAAIELEDVSKDTTSFAHFMEQARTFFTGGPAKTEPKQAEPAKPEAGADLAVQFGQQLSKGFEQLTAALGAMQTDIGGQITKLRGEHEALKTAVETTDASGAQRPLSTGGEGQKFATDC